ncbi:stage III sporulation protein AF [Salibacterium salarium]|uniref:Stage III sporulation protein AF n=1 Tax=Salibacterium salarium TaxID=284579 RepID=A0A428N891_9BACI|nr:stage III sporulation protein AF [Salibacterium salarium]RSL34558.1 stage III sporulation protein AF [Salibacterium salarium]
MEWLSQWMSNLIIFLLAAFLLELLLPSSSFQKYARLVLSFILMLLIIEPILSLTNSASEEKLKERIDTLSDSNFENQSVELQVNNQKNEIEAGQDAYISKQVSIQLKDQVSDHLKEQWGWEVENISFEPGEENETDMDKASVHVSLTSHKEEDNSSSDIETVRIDVEQQSDEIEHTEETNESHPVRADIKTYLAETWEVKEEQISISMLEEGG